MVLSVGWECECAWLTNLVHHGVTHDANVGRDPLEVGLSASGGQLCQVGVNGKA